MTPFNHKSLLASTIIVPIVNWFPFREISAPTRIVQRWWQKQVGYKPRRSWSLQCSTDWHFNEAFFLFLRGDGSARARTGTAERYLCRRNCWRQLVHPQRRGPVHPCGLYSVFSIRYQLLSDIDSFGWIFMANWKKKKEEEEEFDNGPARMLLWGIFAHRKLRQCPLHHGPCL